MYVCTKAWLFWCLHFMFWLLNEISPLWRVRIQTHLCPMWALGTVQFIAPWTFLFALWSFTLFARTGIQGKAQGAPMKVSRTLSLNVSTFVLCLANDSSLGLSRHPSSFPRLSATQVLREAAWKAPLSINLKWLQSLLNFFSFL